MRRFLTKLSVFAVLNAAFACAFLAAFDRPEGFHEWNTHSRLLLIEHDKDYEAVILGSSRANLMSGLEETHAAVEAALGGPVVNLASFGGGVTPNLVFLRHFYARGNRTERIVYLLDPFALSSHHWNHGRVRLGIEPFRLSVALDLLRNGFPPGRVWDYFQTKFQLSWLRKGPVAIWPPPRAIPEDRSQAVQERLDVLYDRAPIDDATFEQYGEKLGEVLALAAQHNSKIVIVRPPTLLGKVPGSARLDRLLERYRDAYEFAYYDWSAVFDDEDLFFDLDHLNPSGIERFCTKYLSRIAAEGAEPSD